MMRLSADALSRGATLACIALAVAALPAAKSRAQGSAGLFRLTGHVPAAAWASRPAAEVAPAERCDLALALPLRNQGELRQLLSRLYDPKDPLYGHYLSPETFRDRFSPTEAQYEAVAAFVQSRGLTVTATHPNRLLLDVSAPAATVESAFKTRLLWFQSPTGRIFRAPVFEPAIPVELAGQIAGIVGLDNLAVRQPHVCLRGATAENAAPRVTGSGPGGGLSPTDIKTAYDLASVSEDGTGQTLAVFELDGYLASDVRAYENHFGLPHVPLQNVLIDGASGKAGSGALEVTLDIELTAALAPAAARILVYEGPNTDKGVLDIFSRIATDDLAQAISTAWGLPELETTPSVLISENSIFQQLAAQGQTLCAAAGDNGAEDDRHTLSVDDPASQPYVTGAGGTSLTTDGPGGPRARETTWNAGSPKAGAGGGGISAVWSIPAYQVGAVTAGSGGSATRRNVPDVSLNADPQNGYAIYRGGRWQLIGGTSCVAPLWAAFAALANEARASAGLGPVGLLNAVLYPLGEGARGAVDFHDVADGSTNLHYRAVTGYDDATGWGPFDGGNLLSDLSAGASSAQQLPSLSDVQVSPRNLPSAGGPISVSVQVAATTPLASVEVIVTPPSGSPASVGLARDSTTSTYSGTVTLPANHGATAATYRLAFTATDSSGRSGVLEGGTATVAVPDRKAPVVRSGSLSPRTLPRTGGLITVTATATDNVAVASVIATVTKPGGTTETISLAAGAGNRWSSGYTAAPNSTGKKQTYRVSARAFDTSGNRSAAFSLGTFAVAR